MVTSSLGGPLDHTATKKNPFGPGYSQKHRADHTDCLVGGRPGKGYGQASVAYINNIRPLDILTFSGLNTYKLFGGKWKRDPEDPCHPPVLKCGPRDKPQSIPSGPYKGQVVPDVVRSYRASPFAAIIYGSNNRVFFDNKCFSVEEALGMFFMEIGKLFEGSSFHVVFVSTIFPRADDIDENGNVITNVEKFNDLLLNQKTRTSRKYLLRIRDSAGVDRVLPWVPVDMTKELPYEEMHNLEYFCNLNGRKIKRGKNPDLIHVNAMVLEKYYRKLDECIDNFKKSRRRRKR